MMTAPNDLSVPAVRTKKPLSVCETDITRAFIFSISPVDIISLTSASRISFALSETGKTLPPRSVFSFTPADSKKAIVSEGLNADIAEYKKRPPDGMFSITSRTLLSFVTLHLPFPVIKSFLPGSLFRS
ncbi:hypothetical protein SDC9_139904 [bioreactor metagenome]|uniref:Uncharacterized protein n=1 Tax=bioreactor metagenome TaxID=1076179 RepID=A0A645DUG3_9ZZZZ